MTLLDAYALIAALTDEPARNEVEPHLRRHDARVATPNLAETYDRCIRLRGLTRTVIDDAIDALVLDGALQVVPLDDQTARRAGELRARHYHRTRHPVSLADCVATATAELFNEVLATPDAHLAAMARAIGIEVLPLPDSAGRRP